MANENEFKKEGSIKNAELLNPNKDTQQERMERGAQRVPKEGQTWAEINSQGRQDIQKPSVLNNPSNDQAKNNWDKWRKNNPDKNDRISISHDSEVKEIIEKQESKNPNKDVTKAQDLAKDKIKERDYDKDK